MNTHADKTQENKSQSVSSDHSQMQSIGESIFQFVDNRPEAVAQRKLQEVANNSQQVSQLRAFRDMANSSPQAKQAVQSQSITGNNSVQKQQTVQKMEIKTGVVVQRTMDEAVEELRRLGTITVKKKHIKKKFLKTYGIEGSTLEQIQAALNAAREADGPSEVQGIVDMTDNANWPTEGKMVEGDGAIVASSLGWTEDSSNFTCKDPSHTPKGKVYTNGVSFYGADKDGHVGWGFKVWSKTKNKGVLDYAGNITWDGSKWSHTSRGT